MSDAMTGYDTKVEVQLSSTWTELLEVTRVGPPRLTSNEVDATHLRSPNRTMESIKGMRNPGQMAIDLNHVPSSETDEYLLAWDAAGDTRPVRITYPNGAVDTFPAYVLDYGPSDITVDGKLQATGNLKVAGAVVRS